MRADGKNPKNVISHALVHFDPSKFSHSLHIS